MSALLGYHGRYLRIDLLRQSASSIPIAEDVLRRFIGGVGLGTWLMLEECPDGIDPLAPESPLAFVFSPLVGTPLTTSAKFAVVSKSPLTRRLNDSLCSSSFALAGKKTGYDALVIVGRAEAPTILVIDNGAVRFEEAADLWGCSIPEAEAALKRSPGPSFRSAVIGPAGENGVLFASVSHDGRHAGRGGLGAVMGAKLLKAVCVRGDRPAEAAFPEKLVQYSRRLSQQSLGDATAKYRELGTVSNLLTMNRLGTLPTRNFQSGTFEAAEKISPEVLSVGRKPIRQSCAACTIGCAHIFPFGSGGEKRAAGVRMEYENLFALGSLCGIDDPSTVLQASAFCDAAGLDTISAGATIAFAMECAERGLIDAPALQFGNGEALLQMLEQIVQREGLGELLSRGSRAAAEEIGQGAEEFAPQIKGLEIPGYEPRALQSMALGLAVATRGADHNRSGAYQVDFSDRFNRFEMSADAIPAIITTENEAAVMDSLILCKFLRGVFDDRLRAMAEMLSLVTGWDVTTEELTVTAERIITARKWYNIRQGWHPAEDTLPPRFFASPLPEGSSQGAVLDRKQFEQMIRQYNRARGFDDEGWVPRQRLEELQLLAPLPLTAET